MYLVIEHINGNICSHPFIVYNESDLDYYYYGEYLIYSLDDTLHSDELNISILREYKKED